MQSVRDRISGWLVGLVLGTLSRLSPDTASNFCGAVARRIGPWLPQHRIGRANLRAAFPDKDPAWIEATLRGAWENLGRVSGEYVHLGRIWDHDLQRTHPGRVIADPDASASLCALRDDGKPAIIFAAHLGNWELAALACVSHALPTAIVYRMPNSRAIAERVVAIRKPLMGQLIRSRPEAAFEMSRALAQGLHLGMLVDQHYSRGVEVTFFGRRCLANPIVARFARRFECPVVGARVIRLPGNRFRFMATQPLDLPRDSEGKIDVAAATQVIMTVMEGWIRENPEQWLWFHRRWRGGGSRRGKARAARDPAGNGAS